MKLDINYTDKPTSTEESVWEFFGRGCLMIGEILIICLTIYIVINYLYTGGYIT